MSRSIAAMSIDLNSDAVRGLATAAFLAGAFFFAAAFFGAASVTSPVAASTVSAGWASAASTTASGSGSSSVTYGPNRPSLATMVLPFSGFTPITRSVMTGAFMSSRAFAGVSSSGARSGGMFTRRGGASGSASGSTTSR